MKTCVRLGSLVIALGLAGFLAGCVSDNATAKTTRRARDFEIVETSTKRTLTPKEMAQLQAMVAEYLQKEGATGSGDYYVKVFLTPDKEGVPGEWVVVRYSRGTEYVATHFSLMSSYPDYGYSSYYPRYNFDYYPFGWFGLSAFALSYYDDPFYYYGGHGGFHTRPPYGHHGDRRWDRDRHRDPKPGGHTDQDRPRGDYRPPGGFKPSFKPTNGTSTTHWSGSPSQEPRPRDGNYSNHSDSRQRWRDRANDNSSPAAGTGTPYTPTYRPPSPPAVTDSSGNGRSHRTTGNRDGNQTEYRRPSHDTSGSSRQMSGGQDRPSSSRGNSGLKPSHESQRRESPREVRSSSYAPPAPARSDPAPAYTPPASRSDSSESHRSSSRDGSHDGGRRARSE